METVNFVNAFAVVEARLGGAVVDVRLADDTGVARRTDAPETIHVVDTSTT